MFATPIAAISWLPSTVVAAPAAKVRDRTPVSVKAISAMPARARRATRHRAHCEPAERRRRQTLRQRADDGQLVLPAEERR